MPRKSKNKTIRKAAIEAKQSEVTKTIKIRKEPTKAEELEFLGEWLAQEY